MAASGMVGLGFVPGTRSSSATGVSANGKVVVGFELAYGPRRPRAENAANFFPVEHEGGGRLATFGYFLRSTFDLPTESPKIIG